MNKSGMLSILDSIAYISLDAGCSKYIGISKCSSRSGLSSGSSLKVVRAQTAELIL